MSPKNSTYHCTTSQPTLLQFIQPCLNQIHIINMLPATSTQSTTLTLMQNPTPTPNNPTPATFPPPPQQQPPIMPPTENVAWGNINQYERPMDHFRVISKNVSTINIYLLDMLAIATELQKIEASVFWPRKPILHRIQSPSKPFKHKVIKCTPIWPLLPWLSQDFTDLQYQTGSTLTLILSKWMPCTHLGQQQTTRLMVLCQTSEST